MYALVCLMITLGAWVWLLIAALPAATSFAEGAIIFTAASIFALCILVFLGAIGYFATIIGNLWADIERRYLR